MHFTQDGVDEPGSGVLFRLLDQFDTFGDRGVRWDAIQITKLIDAHLKGNANVEFELGLGAAGEIADQEIELTLIAEDAHDDGFGKTGVARVEVGAFVAQQV